MELLSIVLLAFVVFCVCAVGGGDGDGDGGGDLSGISGADIAANTAAEADFGFGDDSGVDVADALSGISDATSSIDSLADGGKGSGSFNTNLAMSVFSALSVINPGIALAAGLAAGLSGLADGTGDVADIGTGPGGDVNGNLDMRYGSNPTVKNTGLSTTGQQAKSITGQEVSGSIKKRGRESTLMTGPLGLLGKPAIERKSLMQRQLRPTLG